MNDYQMGAVESKFADIIWQNEPLSSAELARFAEEGLGWKKSTTYTVLRRLCDKGIFKNEGGTVASVISKEEFYSIRSEQFVNEEFGGSLPSFFAAFTARKKLTKEEAAELRRMVEKFEED